MGEINVVPYIDVMLVLLIIFMVTAPMLSQGIKVDLPQAAAEPIEPDDLEPLLLSIDRERRAVPEPRRSQASAGARTAARDSLLPRCAGNPSAPYWSRRTGPSPTAASWRAWCCCSRLEQEKSDS